MSEKMPLIRLEGIQKVFTTEELETHALSDIHMEVEDGEFVEVVGPSGCGKSTLLSLLGLLDTPTAGDYWLDGEPVADLTASERAKVRNQHIGFIFQAFNLIGDLTVEENVELPLTYRGMAAAERKQKVQSALEKVDMSHRIDHFPSQLSGGQQQRVTIARSLVNSPEIVWADEPTGNLDSGNSREIMDLLCDLNTRNGQTFVLVTHSDEVASRANRIITMHDGEIARDGQTGDGAAKAG